MTYKNTDVIKEFLSNGDEGIKAKHLFFEKNVLYSYGFHFPLCVKLFGGFIINLNGHSNTTSTHKGHLIRSLTNYNTSKEFERAYKKNKDNFSILLLGTEKIKEVLNENPNTLEEVKNLLILKAL